MFREKTTSTSFFGILLLAFSLMPGLSDGKAADRRLKTSQLQQKKNEVSTRTVRQKPLVRRQSRKMIKIQMPARIQTSAYAPDRIMVKFKPEVTIQSRENMIAAYQMRDVQEIPRINVFRMKVPEGMSVEETLALLQFNPDVDYARPVYKTRIFDIPNDSFFMLYQYNLYNRGIVLDITPEIQPQTTAGADIKATPAWDVTTGNPEVVIAVLDTGADMTHLELQNKVVSSGRDFVNDDSDATDDSFHGTHVAGVAAAETDNAEGIAGVAWNCKILPVKVIDQEGTGYYDDMIEGIIWAVDNGAKVLNLSLGGDVADPALEAACKYAYDNGAVMVAAAGNDALNAVAYPAAYDDYVLAVAATDWNDEVASFNNYGPEIDVAAPGMWILSAAPQWYVGEEYLPYLFVSGTSTACPHVAGFAALLFSFKSWLTPDQVMNIIRYTADDVNSSSYAGKDDYIGYGRINMERGLVPYKLK